MCVVLFAAAIGFFSLPFLYRCCEAGVNRQLWVQLVHFLDYHCQEDNVVRV